MPRSWRPRIALVGAGGISAAHLAAYRDYGFDVAVVCSRTLQRAVARRDEFFPDAEATDDVARTLGRDDIEVVDLTPHPGERLALIEAALGAGKHVLSQKPFVLDLDEKRVNPELVELAPVTGKAAEELKGLVEQHAEETGSAVAAALLADWDASLARFTEVMPSDFKRVLEAREEALEDGLDEDEAAARIMEVLHG